MREPAGDQAADRRAGGPRADSAARDHEIEAGNHETQVVRSPAPPPRSLAAAIMTAAGGAAYAARRHPNLRTHIAIAGLVLLGGAAAGCSAVELALLAGAIGFVLVAELVNTSIEMLTDFVCPRYDPRAAAIKDVSAAAVLVASGAAAALAVFIVFGRAWPGTPLPGRTAAALGAACLAAFALAVGSRTGDA